MTISQSVRLVLLQCMHDRYKPLSSKAKLLPETATTSHSRQSILCTQPEHTSGSQQNFELFDFESKLNLVCDIGCKQTITSNHTT